MKTRLTAHCLVKNEEYFIEYAIRSVIDYVDRIIVFDTGSQDKTVEIIERLVQEYHNKIVFEEKGPCNKKEHTYLRQKMIEMTETEWFMILDGDEIWTNRAMEEALYVIESNNDVECLISPFYLCVGDIYHQYYKKGNFEMLNKRGLFFPRFIKNIKSVHWLGDYNHDALVFADGKVVFRENNTKFLINKYWHVTHLRRSSLDDEDYSSYGKRKDKRRETYFLIGRRIKEPIPKVFLVNNKKPYLILTRKNSFINFLILIKNRFIKDFVN